MIRGKLVIIFERDNHSSRSKDNREGIIAFYSSFKISQISSIPAKTEARSIHPSPLTGQTPLKIQTSSRLKDSNKYRHYILRFFFACWRNLQASANPPPYPPLRPSALTSRGREREQGPFVFVEQSAAIYFPGRMRIRCKSHDAGTTTMGYGNASSHASIQPLDRLRAHAIFSRPSWEEMSS